MRSPGPPRRSGNVIGNLNQRRGSINDSETRDEEFVAQVDVSLNDMFGYSGALRGMTQGKGEFSMEYKVRSGLVAKNPSTLPPLFLSVLSTLPPRSFPHSISGSSGAVD